MELTALIADVIDPEFLVCLQEAIGELSPRQRQVLLLTVQGYSQREIAEMLGIAQRTACEYLQAARKKLSATL